MTITPEQVAHAMGAHRADNPPMPVRVHNLADVLLTARATWRQPTVPVLLEPKPIRYDDPDWQTTMTTANTGWAAANAGRAENPLRHLAHALLKFADQLDADGHVPLGVNITTAYESGDGALGFFDERLAAAVTVTVRGVRRAWIDQAIAAAAAVLEDK